MDIRDAANILVNDLRDLMNQSEGVAGLHNNGDVASWDELLDSPGMSPWLGDAYYGLKAAIENDRHCMGGNLPGQLEL